MYVLLYNSILSHIREPGFHLLLHFAISIPLDGKAKLLNEGSHCQSLRQPPCRHSPCPPFSGEGPDTQDAGIHSALGVSWRGWPNQWGERGLDTTSCQVADARTSTVRSQVESERKRYDMCRRAERQNLWIQESYTLKRSYERGW